MTSASGSSGAAPRKATMPSSAAGVGGSTVKAKELEIPKQTAPKSKNHLV